MNIRLLLRKAGVKNIATAIIGFFLGRVSIFDGMMPFGISFFVSVYAGGIRMSVAAVPAMAGMMLSGAGSGVLTGMLPYIVLLLFLRIAKGKKSFIYVAGMTSLAVLAVKLAAAGFQGFLLYDILMAVFEASLVFISALIFKNAANFLLGQREGTSISHEDIVSLVVLLSAASEGVPGTGLLGVSLTRVAGIYMVLLSGYGYGAAVGTAAGVIVGLMGSMGSYLPPVTVGAYAFCGLITGISRGLGRTGTCMGFLTANSFFTLYMNGSVEPLIMLKDIAVAAAAFLGTPQGFLKHHGIIGCLAARTLNGKTYAARTRNEVIGRLKNFASAFAEISRTVNEISSARDAAANDVMSVIERAADKICNSCNLCLVCWERNYYSTYHTMLGVIEKLKEKGYTETLDVPDYFEKSCVRMDELIREVNNSYDMFKMERIWRGKLEDSRQIVYTQFESIAGAISDFAAEMDYDADFMLEAEEAAIGQLERAGLDIRDVMIYKNGDGRCNVVVYHADRLESTGNTGAMEKIISNITGRKMVRIECASEVRGDEPIYESRFAEREKYGVAIGIARRPKICDTVSGDHFAFNHLAGGKYMAALSDGMGTGTGAAKKSEQALNLLEIFLGAGFGKSFSVRMVDSILMTDPTEDSFATVDAVIIDLYTGRADFVKRGAMPSYIIDDKGIRETGTASVPAGVIEEGGADETMEVVEGGGFIVLVTDGVYDYISGTFQDGGEMTKLLRKTQNSNPQEFADAIMREVVGKHGMDLRDDMLVMVIKLWERV